MNVCMYGRLGGKFYYCHHHHHHHHEELSGKPKINVTLQWQIFSGFLELMDLFHYLLQKFEKHICCFNRKDAEVLEQIQYMKNIFMQRIYLAADINHMSFKMMNEQ